jgi:hypothetical protein
MSEEFVNPEADEALQHNAPSAYDKIRARIEGEFNAEDELHPYWTYEPWDVGPRSEEQLQAAVGDGVDLDCEDLLKHVGPAPHLFQTGFLHSTKFFTGKCCAGRVGKSMNVLVKIGCRLTGQVPFSLRYPHGKDTGIKRPITTENILRFGRRSKGSNEIIDYNPNVKFDPKEWDCGNIIGKGYFPTELIGKDGSFIRLASKKQVLKDYWFPILYENVGNWIPQELRDLTKGYGGVNKGDKTVHFIRHTRISILGYDLQGFSFEGEEPIYTVLDEEPSDPRIKDAVISHTQKWSLITTPYRGITWSRDLFFPPKKDGDSETFHCTAHDSPYVTSDLIRVRRKQMPKHEIVPRIWGLPTSQTGASPYFGSSIDKISIWVNRVRKMTPKLVKFVPEQEYNGINTDPHHAFPGLLDVRIRMVEVDEDNGRNTWRLYEDKQPDTGYLCASDQANGAETVEAVGDWNAGGIARPHTDDPTRPVMAASIRSSAPPLDYAWTMLMACRYFNNAILCPESDVRGSANGAFINEVHDWPWWYRCGAERWSTKKRITHLGFDVNAGTRDQIFELVADWFSQYEADEFPEVPDQWIMEEALSAEVKLNAAGKRRCDHPSDKTLDSLTMFGIMLYVFKNSHHIITDNSR